MRGLLIKLVFCVVLILISIGANAQSKAFKKLAKIEDVEHVHINKFLLRLAAKYGGDINLSERLFSDNIVKKINDLRVFNAETKESAEELNQGVRSILNGDGWETLIDVNDEDGEKVKIYQYQKGKHTTVAILTEEDDEMALLVITGKIDIAKLIEQVNKD